MEFSQVDLEFHRYVRPTEKPQLTDWASCRFPGSTYVFLNVCLDFIWLIFAFWFSGFLNVFSWAGWPFARTFASNWRGYSSPGLTRWFGRFRSRAWKPYALCPLKTGHNVSPVWIVKKCGFPGFHLCQSFGPEWSTSRRISHWCGCIYLWQESIYRTQVGMLGKLQLWTLSHFCTDFSALNFVDFDCKLQIQVGEPSQGRYHWCGLERILFFPGRAILILSPDIWTLVRSQVGLVIHMAKLHNPKVRDCFQGAIWIYLDLLGQLQHITSSALASFIFQLALNENASARRIYGYVI